MAACNKDLRQFQTSEQLYFEILKFVEQQGLGQEYVSVGTHSVSVSINRDNNCKIKLFLLSTDCKIVYNELLLCISYFYFSRCSMYLYCSVLNDLAVTYDKLGNISAAIENYEKSLSLMRKQSNVNPLNLSTSAFSNYKRLCIITVV